ncbi:hypothetical protein V8D89_003884 [Ganoderma adspersum]
MFIYNGKFNWLNYASDETITVVFPACFALNDPVSAYWQWSVDAEGNKKPSVATSGAVQSTFDASVAADYKTLTLTMRNPGGNTSEPFDLLAMHINPTAVRSTAVYTSALDYYSYAKGELATLVVPYGVTAGAFFGLYHQWTVDSGGSEKTNHAVNGVFEDVQYAADGTVTATFGASYYSYSFTFGADGKGGSWVLSNSRGGKSPDNKLALTYEL